MILPLNGKRVIFFCPKFFGYEKEIIREMESLGADVTFHGQLPSDHPWIKALFRLFPKLAWRYSDRYFMSWLKEYGPTTCDIIFVVKGEGLSPGFLNHLKYHYPNARMILHLWDSLVNCKNIQQKLIYFDSLSSFDPDDCERMPQFKYRPLFFLDKYLNLEQGNTGSGVFFIGTLNGDRPRIIHRLLETWNSSSQIVFWLFVRSRLEFMLRNIIDKSLRRIDSSHFIYKSMPVSTVAKYLKESAAVLDIEHPKQSGLTMRTFEVIASGKKLITTNKKVAGHDFYDPARICIIDRNDPRVLDEFLAISVPPLSERFLVNYSLKGWILEILS